MGEVLKFQPPDVPPTQCTFCGSTEHSSDDRTCVARFTWWWETCPICRSYKTVVLDSTRTIRCMECKSHFMGNKLPQ